MLPRGLPRCEHTSSPGPTLCPGEQLWQLCPCSRVTGITSLCARVSSTSSQATIPSDPDNLTLVSLALASLRAQGVCLPLPFLLCS